MLGMQYVCLGFVCVVLGVALMTIAWIIYKPRSKQRENCMDFNWLWLSGTIASLLLSSCPFRS
ncbi:hypothetical protein BC830DRAFT_1155697 [Chytriomyces sp. MP71]|nr:hypothetical protein BC830DRAFT_1155697 [Chytriomyces sp. MP71]